MNYNKQKQYLALVHVIFYFIEKHMYMYKSMFDCCLFVFRMHLLNMVPSAIEMHVC